MDPHTITNDNIVKIRKVLPPTCRDCVLKKHARSAEFQRLTSGSLGICLGYLIQREGDSKTGLALSQHSSSMCVARVWKMANESMYLKHGLHGELWGRAT